MPRRDEIFGPQVTWSEAGEIILTWFNHDDRLEVILDGTRHVQCATLVNGRVNFVGTFDFENEESKKRLAQEIDSFLIDPYSL